MRRGASEIVSLEAGVREEGESRGRREEVGERALGAKGEERGELGSGGGRVGRVEAEPRLDSIVSTTTETEGFCDKPRVSSED